MERSTVFDSDTIAIVLAGGMGERLQPLTRDRGKPAVPFGGIYRIIDFTLSNCLNSGVRRIYVLTQYKSRSLERHIQLGWDSLFAPELGEWIYTVPPQLRVGQRWYEGTADAVFQNLDLIERDRPKYVIVLSGDHVYKMDYRKLVEYHVARGGKATVGAVEVDLSLAGSFGNLVVDESFRVTAFEEKPANPIAVPGRDVAFVNMGVYVFEAEALVGALRSDQEQFSTHDFGRDVLPRMVEAGELYAFPFVDENRKSVRYWRDIGTLDAYYEASMDLVTVDPVFNLYDAQWPIRTYPRQLPPAKMVFADEWPGGRLGVALDSLVSGGVIISGGRVERSVLGPAVRVNSYARVQDSVLMDGASIGRHARVRRTIVDKGVQIAPGCVIGYDREADVARFTVTERGVVVIAANTRVEPEGTPLPLDKV